LQTWLQAQPADILQIEWFRVRRDGGGMTLKDD
jgi:hypothetical protein